MDIRLFEFELPLLKNDSNEIEIITDEQINNKYTQGESRIITEQGSIKLPLIRGVFNNDDYTLRPEYQRRITWSNERRSKLIESFIMNIPIPPVFIYETEFGQYQVMDGLQRISTIIDYYNNEYKLTGLTEWKELNGKKYSELPQKIKEGIDRRQLSVVTLLKESTKDKENEEKMKKMVFERLNTGGVKLVDQEVRNALHPGLFNSMCIELSENKTFRELWRIPNNIDEEESKTLIDEEIDYEYMDYSEKFIKNKLYMRMSDVELVLRFFAMRHIDDYNGKLTDFLDLCLIKGNNFTRDNINCLKNLFEESIENVFSLFGENAFCLYKNNKDKEQWSKPNKMIYDPLMLAVSGYNLKNKKFNKIKNIEFLKEKYEEDTNNSDKEKLFNGKKQSKTEIKIRAKFFKDIIEEILNWEDKDAI